MTNKRQPVVKVPNHTRRGKDFEDVVREALESANIAGLRLYDTTNGFAGIHNPCDVLAYSYPFALMLECKSCYGSRFPYSDIRDTQYEDLVKASRHYGIVAGILVWFIEYAEVYFLPIEKLKEMRDGGEKSFNLNKMWDSGYLILPTTVKRINIDIDMAKSVDAIIGDYNGRKNQF